MKQEQQLSSVPGLALSASEGNKKWLILTAVCLGFMMLNIDTFIVNVALPAIQRDFQVPLDNVSWTISGYVLMIGVLPMGIGRLGDIIGQRKVYLGGLLLFVVASLCCGLAQSLTALIVFRVVQGIGAAIMTPGTLAIIIRAFPREQQGLAVGIYGGVTGLGLIAGPILGGVLVHGDDWRWVFFVNIPVGLIALVFTLLFVPEARDEESPTTVDWQGLGLLSVGLLFVLFAFTRSSSVGWGNVMVIASGGMGILALVAFVLIERRLRHPLIDLALFRNTPFVLGCISFFLFAACIFGTQPYWSLFMQNLWGYSPLQGGLAFVPATALVAALTPVGGLLAQRTGIYVRYVLVASMLILSISFFYVAIVINPHSTYINSLLPTLIGRGIGIPIFFSCATLVIMQALPVTKSGLASGTLGMVRNIGTAFGIALFGQVFIGQIDRAIPQRLSFLSMAQQNTSRIAAGQFLATGHGNVHQIMETIVLQGFIVQCWLCVILFAITLILVFFIRVRETR